MKAKILVVDDDEVTRAMVQKALGDDATEVTVAADGADALRMVAKDPPDLILMDVCMPQMNGYDACKALRDNELTKNIPVIMLSSLAEISDQLHGLKCGADDYVTKPLDLVWLASKVKNVLLRKRIKENKAE